MKKITFGVIVSSRSLFPVSLAVQGRKDIQELLERLGYGCVILSENDTPHGVVETYADAQRCAALFRAHREEISGILVILPNFGDEAAVADTLSLAALGVPVLVQAYNDSMDKLDLDHRRDSFCGKLSVCANLYQKRIPYTLTSRHTSDVDSPSFEADLKSFAAVCRVVGGVQGLRIGAIGARPDAFRTVRFSEKLLEASGITVVPVDMSEIIAAAKAIPSGERLQRALEEVRGYAPIEAGTSEEKLVLQAKLLSALEDWMTENHCQASAIQCWTSIQKNFGVASCLAMAMMGSKGFPSACETDVMGALSMYLLQLASGSPSGYMDWNNGLASEENKCVNIHCSNYPKEFIAGPATVGNLDIMSRSIGSDICFGALKCVVAPGDITFAKANTDDFSGKIKLYTGHGSFTADPIQTPGGPGVCQVENLQGLMRYIASNGFEHHVALNRSHTADILQEALGHYLGWQVYRHS
ncbi:MAG: fucose isomerase [Candidatus Limiplasma sp.]|nr:fucose isomerase [Candidatus Limiplasma sp.]